MKLTAYVIDGHKLSIRPAPLERQWMEQSNQRFAYRCLPLNIANTYGWEILCPSAFNAIWHGSSGLDAVQVTPASYTSAPAVSHFGEGIMTFHVPCLFRTDPGVDLLVQGPINRPKDALAPLTGVIETDWAPYTFTMNWKFTRPEIPVRFEQGEPFCHIFPIERAALERVEPELRLLSETSELKQEFDRWTRTRSQFNADLKEPGSTARSDEWQKRYYRGLDSKGRRATKDHRTRLRLLPFTK
jgi:hypothetical protein